MLKEGERRHVVEWERDRRFDVIVVGRWRRSYWIFWRWKRGCFGCSRGRGGDGRHRWYVR